VLTERLVGAIERVAVSRGWSSGRAEVISGRGRELGPAELLAQESGLSAAYYVLTLVTCVLAIAVLPVLQYRVSHSAWRVGLGVFTGIGAAFVVGSLLHTLRFVIISAARRRTRGVMPLLLSTDFDLVLQSALGVAAAIASLGGTH
jgi:uncharacterized membrane protein YeiH